MSDNEWQWELLEAFSAAHQASVRHRKLLLKAVEDGRDWDDICISGHISSDALEYLVVEGYKYVN